ncbi:MAG: DegT/DnrJ/EryC1/StrS family aminotransferase [Candidatus Roizmanbacteria bacterium]
MQIPVQFFDREYAEINTTLWSACKAFFRSGRYILGSQVELFENKFAHSIGVPHAVGVGNGTDAITLAIKALGVLPGAEVITSAVSAYATVVGITQAGCIPVLVDIDPTTGLIDLTKVEKRISKKTAAIIPVHLYGQMVDMRQCMRIAKKYKLYVIEDCAQSYGAKCHSKYAGAWGDIGTFSFYPTKNLGAYGDGGMVTTNNAKTAKLIKSMRNYGQGDRYHHNGWGINSRLDELQAALLNVKMKKTNTWILARLKIASRYHQEIESVEHLTTLPGSTHTYHLYVVKHPRRNELQRYLAKEGVTTLIHYPIAQHGQKAFSFPHTTLPHAEKFCNEILSLPLSAHMTNKEVQYVIDAVNGFSK